MIITVNKLNPTGSDLGEVLQRTYRILIEVTGWPKTKKLSQAF